jgi:hypothetical protein
MKEQKTASFQKTSTAFSLVHWTGMHIYVRALYIFIYCFLQLSLSSAVHIFNLAVRPFVLMDLFKIMIIININKVIAKNEKDLL